MSPSAFGVIHPRRTPAGGDRIRTGTRTVQPSSSDGAKSGGASSGGANSDGKGPLLAVRGLEKTLTGGDERVPVLRGVDLTLEAGHSLALTGESGSGKSTLLHLVAGLDVADAGQVRLAGQDVGALSDAGRARLRREAVGLVFQQFNLIPSLTVAGNLGFQARLAGRFDADAVAALAARLGLEGLMNRYPEQLSGGQQQRVAIGRALAARPALVLADEPTGNLDEATGDAVLDLMLELVRDAGVALLMVTHSPRLAARCDARLHLRAGRTTEAP
ncbi:ABC transporter ATP-binding protein [Rhodobaculum claviforme]|uniref:ABC transporter ATP-binding protein n=1 Tax=Rhodobaculum claviforme TaxID=1549854 RepID=A0A934WI67_9RHOB|nr:ABC transporter ATP-binding protein [Rhodobaculum claviforme]